MFSDQWKTNQCSQCYLTWTIKVVFSFICTVFLLILMKVYKILQQMYCLFLGNVSPLMRPYCKVLPLMLWSYTLAVWQLLIHIDSYLSFSTWGPYKKLMFQRKGKAIFPFNVLSKHKLHLLWDWSFCLQGESLLLLHIWAMLVVKNIVSNWSLLPVIVSSGRSCVIEWVMVFVQKTSNKSWR